MLERVLDSIEVFFENLAAVDFGAAGIALLFHLVRGLAVSRAWRNVIAAAYPNERVRWSRIYGSYAAGVGVNAVIPARGGDAVRLYLARRGIPDSTYTTLASTLLVPAIFDIVAASTLLTYAISQGALPDLDVLPNLPSFDFGWLFDNPRLAAALGALLGISLLVLGLWLPRHVRAFRERFRQGLVILGDRRAYVRRVAFWQAIDWSCRLATTYWFLRAFGIHADIDNALHAQVAQSLATALPISPGGIGTEQALLVYLLSGQAPHSALLSYSVGMKLTLLAFNLTIGFAALFLMIRTLRWRGAVDASRRAEQTP